MFRVLVRPRASLVLALASLGMTACPPPQPGPPPPPGSSMPLLFVGSSVPAVEIFSLTLGGPKGLPQMTRLRSGPRPSVAPSAMGIVGTSLLLTGGSPNGVVEQYSIDATAGTLTLRGTAPAGNQPMGLATTATHAYVANRISENIIVYRVDAATGLVAQQTLGVPGAVKLAIDGSGKFLFSGNRASASPVTGPRICAHPIQPDGSLGTTPVCTAVAEAPTVMRFANGTLFSLIYALPGPTHRVTAWTVDANTGALTRRGDELDIGAANTADMAVSTNGSTLFIPRQGGFSTVTTSDPLRLGSITFQPMASQWCILPPPGPGQIIADPRGTALYVTDPIGVVSGNIIGPRVSELELEPSGGLAPVVCETAGSLPWSMALYSP